MADAVAIGQVELIQTGQNVPLYRAISEHFTRLIREGRLRPGDRLPTVRELAAATGFNKSTIVQGFSELQRAGLVHSRTGSGTVVAAHATAPPPAAAATSRRIDSLYRSLRSDGSVSNGRPSADFSALWPEPSLFPLAPMRRIFQRLLRGRPELLQYGTAQGYGLLREYLENRAAHAGIGAGEAIIVQGSQQGLDLVFRSFLDPGDSVAVESPTYASILPHLAFHEARVVPIPMREDGLDVDALETALRRDRVKLLYFMPNFQNPTGITMSEPKRQALARLAATAGLLLVEDDFEHDLRFAGRDLAPVAGRPGVSAIYLSSFSKSLLPGLRMGWMIAPSALVEPLVLAKKYTDIYTSIFTQAALLEFCRSGEYERHLRRVRRACREKVARAHRAVLADLPKGTTCRMPEGGFLLWVTLPDGYSAEALAAEAAREGIRITPGSVYHADGQGVRCFRLSLSLVPTDRIVPGIRSLGRLLRRDRSLRSTGAEKRNALEL